jgi:hypothetical protein
MLRRLRARDLNLPPAGFPSSLDQSHFPLDFRATETVSVKAGDTVLSPTLRPTTRFRAFRQYEAAHPLGP